MTKQIQIIHEQASNGQHRLVVLKDGIPTRSRWYEAREVGLFEGRYFHVGAAGESVPTVFRVTSVPHEVL